MLYLVHQWKSRSFGEIIDWSQPTCFSLAEGNSTGSIILEKAHSSSEFNGFPRWSDLSGCEEKTGFVPPRRHRLLQAITLLWFNSLLANTHTQSICVHRALTPVPAWLRKTSLSISWVNAFHPVQQSWSESLSKGNCNRHPIFRLYYLYYNILYSCYSIINPFITPSLQAQDNPRRVQGSRLT